MATPAISEIENLIKALDSYQTAVADLERDLSKAHEDVKEIRASSLNLTKDYLAVQHKLKDTESCGEETIRQLKAELELVRQQTKELQNNNQELRSLKNSKCEAMHNAKIKQELLSAEKASLAEELFIMNMKLLRMVQFLEQEYKELDGAPSCAEPTDTTKTVLDDESKAFISKWFQELWFLQLLKESNTDRVKD